MGMWWKMPRHKVRRINTRTWLPRTTGGKIIPVEEGLPEAFDNYRARNRDYAINAMQVAFIDRPMITMFDHFMGDSLDAKWNTSTGGGGGGTVGIIDSQLGGVARFSLGLLIGSWIRMDFNNIRQINKSLNPKMRVRVKFLDVVDIKVRVGFYNASDTQDFIWFENDPSGSAVNWFGKTDNAASGSSVDLGVVANLTDWQVLEIRVDNANTVAGFFIDDVLKGSINGATLPTADLQPLIYLESDSNIDAKAFLVDYIKLDMDEAA